MPEKMVPRRKEDRWITTLYVLQESSMKPKEETWEEETSSSQILHHNESNSIGSSSTLKRIDDAGSVRNRCLHHLGSYKNPTDGVQTNEVPSPWIEIEVNNCIGNKEGRKQGSQVRKNLREDSFENGTLGCTRIVHSFSSRRIGVLKEIRNPMDTGSETNADPGAAGGACVLPYVRKKGTTNEA